MLMQLLVSQYLQS